MSLPTPTPLTDAEIEAKHTAREVVARWLTTNGFATGHGDTLYDLLYELEHQVRGLQSDLQRTRDVLTLTQGRIEALRLQEDVYWCDIHRVIKAALTPPTGESK